MKSRIKKKEIIGVIKKDATGTDLFIDEDSHGHSEYCVVGGLLNACGWPDDKIHELQRDCGAAMAGFRDNYMNCLSDIREAFGHLEIEHLDRLAAINDKYDTLAERRRQLIKYIKEL